jgi:hypothetical protein
VDQAATGRGIRTRMSNVRARETRRKAS